MSAKRTPKRKPSLKSLRVADALEVDLMRLEKRAPALARSGLAASAMALARELDGANSATSKAMCAKALSDTLDRLWGLAPEEETSDGLDDLAAKRAARRAKAAG